MKKTWILFLILVLYFGCKESIYQATKISSETLEINSTIQQDSSIIKAYLPFKDKMTQKITEVLTYAPATLDRNDGILQSSLGNLIADLSYQKANELFKKETGKSVDFFISNFGGIRATIAKGNVTVSNVFELMPFDNTLVVAELSAEKTEALFAFLINKNIAHPLSKEVKIVVNNYQYQVHINDKPIQQNKTYFVATSNYLQNGGDGMNFFADPKSLYDSNFLIREAITAYFTDKDTLISRVDNRIVINKSDF